MQRGVRERTQDLDACVAASQCTKLLDWLLEKERDGRVIELVPGCAPLHPDWLGGGWFCHVCLDGLEMDFFGLPMRSPPTLVQRYGSDPRSVEAASLVELGYLKRTGREKDWADVDRLAAILLRESGAEKWTHLFGDALADALIESRGDAALFAPPAESTARSLRPILQVGHNVTEAELRVMARAERAFWVEAGALRREAIKQAGQEFWSKHGVRISAQGSFAAAHAELMSLAKVDLPRHPVADPFALIEKAREVSDVNRWPGLLPESGDLLRFYFPGLGSRVSIGF